MSDPVAAERSRLLKIFAETLARLRPDYCGACGGEDFDHAPDCPGERRDRPERPDASTARRSRADRAVRELLELSATISLPTASDDFIVRAIDALRPDIAGAWHEDDAVGILARFFPEAYKPNREREHFIVSPPGSGRFVLAPKKWKAGL